MQIDGCVDQIYKNAIEYSKYLIFWVAQNGSVCYCNSAFINFFKQQKTGACTLEYTDIECFCKNINIKDFDKFFKENGDWQHFFEGLSEEPILYETIYTNNEGKTMPVEFYASMVKDKNRALIVAKKITERKRIEFKIKRATDELIRSNKDLQEFAYIASHDLKEPLRKISMFSNKLLTKCHQANNDECFKLELPDEECELYLNKIVNSSIKMQDMISSILEYSRVGTSGEDFSCCNMIKIINNSIENCETSLEECAGKVVLEDIKNKEVFADCRQIVHVFQNLISNSIKFKSKDRELVIKIGQTKKIKENRMAFFVEDNGIGVKGGFCEKIFTPFQRLHSKDKFTGHGMGLSICKKIIERHGGQITAQSVENEWTRIEFDLQMCKSPN